MGGEPQNTQESMAEVLKAMESYLPGTLASIRGTYPAQSKAEYDVAEQYTPKYAALQAKTLDKEGRELARVGRDLAKEDQLGASETELAIAQGPGRKITQEAVDLQKLVEPEYYKTREELSAGITKALSAIDPNKLSGGEIEQVARGLGRTGSFVPSAQESNKNAMVFGDRLAQRRAEYNSTLGLAAGALSPMRTGFTGFEAATKRTLTPNVGVGAYTGVQSPGVATSNQIGGQYLNNATAMQQQVQSKQKDWLDKVQGITKSISNVGSMFNPISMGG